MSCKTCQRIREKWREILARRDIRRAEARARARRLNGDEPPFPMPTYPGQPPPFRNVPPEDRDR